MRHEYACVVEEVGADVSPAKPGQFVIGSFKRISDDRMDQRRTRHDRERG